jgi:hypothetical protein
MLPTVDLSFLGKKKPFRFDLLNNPFVQKGAMGLEGALGIGMTLANATSSIPEVQRVQQAGYTDMFNTPQYNLGGLQSNIKDIQRSDPSSGLVGSTALQGASTGAAVGGVPGALIGGAVGAIAGLFGADSAEDEKRKREQEARRRLYTAQENFNRQNEAANRNRLAYEQYMQMIS